MRKTFPTWILAAFMLAVLLLANSVVNYLHFSGQVLRAEIQRELALRAAVFNVALERGARPGDLDRVVDSAASDARVHIVWLRVRNERGEIIANSGAAGKTPAGVVVERFPVNLPAAARPFRSAAVRSRESGTMEMAAMADDPFSRSLAINVLVAALLLLALSAVVLKWLAF